jgi:predicted transcriptional regulator
MLTQNAKQEALDAIQRLPDNVDFEEIVYRLHVLNKVHRGLKYVEEGRVIPAEEIQREIEQW